MIKSNELRLGVLAIESNVTHKGITEKIISVSIKDIMNHQNLNPIPLTEEWLLKFGFIFDENKGFDYINDDGEISNIEDNPLWYKNYSQKRFCVYLKKLTCYVSLNCKYVHDLQNCYFIVTGQELELK